MSTKTNAERNLLGLGRIKNAQHYTRWATRNYRISAYWKKTHTSTLDGRLLNYVALVYCKDLDAFENASSIYEVFEISS